MSKTILATCGAPLVSDGYCTAPVYLDHPDDRPRCDVCHKVSQPRIVGPARMHALAAELTAAPEYSHDEEAARLLVYAAAKIEELDAIEALEASLRGRGLREQRKDGETTARYVLRLIDHAYAEMRELKARVHTLEAAAPLGGDQATLHAG